MNTLYALDNIASNIHYTIVAFIRHQIVWGFILGFVIATSLHFVILSENPKYLSQIITSRDSAKSFMKIATRDELGRYQLSYSSFTKEFAKTRYLFDGIVLLFLGIVFIALLRY